MSSTIGETSIWDPKINNNDITLSTTTAMSPVQSSSTLLSNKLPAKRRLAAQFLPSEES